MDRAAVRELARQANGMEATAVGQVNAPESIEDRKAATRAAAVEATISRRQVAHATPTAVAVKEAKTASMAAAETAPEPGSGMVDTAELTTGSTERWHAGRN